jgi:hypothetical protein
LLLADLLMDRQKRRDHSEEQMTFAQQLADLIANCRPIARGWQLMMRNDRANDEANPSDSMRFSSAPS